MNTISFRFAALPLRYAALAAPFLLGGCTGAFWGNLMVLGVTVGIFVATLSLGRSADARSTAGSTHSRG